MDIALFYQADEWKCGPGSWIVHLYNGLRKMGYTPEIYKIYPGSEGELNYDVGYEVDAYLISDNLAADICKRVPAIICATHMHKYKDWIYDLIRAGCALVCHTKHTSRYSNEFIKLLDSCNTQIVAVRPAIRDYVLSKGLKSENVTHIPHMYISKNLPEVPRTKNAVCTTRIAPWKNVDIVMKANNILVDDGNAENCVWLHGSYYKGYMQKNVVEKIPGWDDNVYFTGPMYPSCNQGFANGRGYDICSRAGYAIDLTNFPGDNIGLQYCALEMIDAGCVYIGHTKYIDGEILRSNHNCLSVSDPYELVEILMTSYENYQDLAENAKELLEKHRPENIIHYYDDLYDRLSL